MTLYQFPTDPEFRKWAAKIADAVMQAEAAGWKITVGKNAYAWCKYCCPLGAVCNMGENTGPAAPGELAAVAKGAAPNPVWAAAFISAFDWGDREIKDLIEWGLLYVPAYELGLAYRRKYVEGVNAR